MPSGLSNIFSKETLMIRRVSQTVTTGTSRSRTYNQGIMSPLLLPLSYSPKEVYSVVNVLYLYHKEAVTLFLPSATASFKIV